MNFHLNVDETLEINIGIPLVANVNFDSLRDSAHANAKTDIAVNR
jgi:hypothetical protein